ncbi:MAG: hypothetical protein ACP5HT_07255 [Conexivisphaera sp.]
MLANTGLGRAPLEWNPPPWLEGSEFGRILGWIASLGWEVMGMRPEVDGAQIR